MRHWSALACACTVFVTASTSRAQQPSEEDTAAARALFGEGRSLGERGLWEEAADRFRRALELRPSVPIRYNLAVALERIGRLVEATELLREVVREAPARDAARRSAEQTLPDVERRIAHLTVQLDGNEAGDAQVVLDDSPMSAARIGVSVPVDPGEHEIVCRRGTAEVSRRVQVEEGGSAEVRLTVPAPEPAPPPRIAAPPPPAERRRMQFDEPHPPGGGGGGGGVSWPLVGAGGGLLAVGVAIDVIPSSGRNGELDGLDLVPLGLYLGGAVLAAVGLIQ